MPVGLLLYCNVMMIVGVRSAEQSGIKVRKPIIKSLFSSKQRKRREINGSYVNGLYPAGRCKLGKGFSAKITDKVPEGTKPDHIVNQEYLKGETE